MNQPLPPEFCPYRGLEPFDEIYRPYFFGREADTRVVISNLYASSVSVLFGGSGVGKSSVLLAGVIPLLRERGAPVVMYRAWQDPHAAQRLKRDTLAAAAAANGGKALDVDPSLSFDRLLLECGGILERPLFFILDQFEEYFLYDHPADDGQSLDAQLASAVNQRRNQANFLLAMRDDGLSKLDRFQGRIPGILGNLIQLDRLNRDAARDAIICPLEEYNRRVAAGTQPVTIEPKLVDAILEQVRYGTLAVGQTGRGTIDGARYTVETPFLQLVLTRLWECETRGGGRALRLETLHKLGGAGQIVQSHLDGVMETLTPPQQRVAAAAFEYLVTPSGSKIAYGVGDIAGRSRTEPPEMAALLQRLAGSGERIVREVPRLQTRPDEPRYEIFHDVLARAILDWASRYRAREERAEAARKAQAELEEEQRRAAAAGELAKSRKRLVALFAVLAFVSLLAVAATGYALRQSRNLRAQRVQSQVQQIEFDKAKLEIAETTTRIVATTRRAAEAEQAVDKAKAESAAREAELRKSREAAEQELKAQLKSAEKTIADLGDQNAANRAAAENYAVSAKVAAEKMSEIERQTASLRKETESARTAELEARHRLADYEAQLRIERQRREAAEKNASKSTKGPAGNVGRGCFPAGTLVRTPHGEVPIEQIVPGQEILAVQPTGGGDGGGGGGGGTTVRTRVVAVHRQRDAVLTVRTDQGALVTTAVHPIMQWSGDFRPAGSLKAGDVVVLHRRNDEAIAAVRVAADPTAGDVVDVYDLSVGDPHTFIADGFVVHNKDP